jgi:hypothetical protein
MCSGYKLPATVLNVDDKFVPTCPITVTAATAISAAISPYSIAVAPLSLHIISFNNAMNLTVTLPTVSCASEIYPAPDKT